MKFSATGSQGSRTPIFRATNVPALLALVVIALAWLFAEQQSRQVFQHDLHSKVLGQVSLIRAKLEGNINGNIQLVR